MTLEDFERQLAEEKRREARESEKGNKIHREKPDRERHHRHHHHRSSRDKDDDNIEDEHRTKRRKHDNNKEPRRRHRHHRSPSLGDNDEEQKSGQISENKTDLPNLKRDSWMEAPSALAVDYVQRKPQELTQTQSGSRSTEYGLKIHQRELNHHLKDLNSGEDTRASTNLISPHEIDYRFGDAGSQWRMTKLKAVYRQSKESGRPVDEVALERYGSLQDFDDAREEELELSRRDTYGKDYIEKDKPSGEFSRERADTISSSNHAKPFAGQREITEDMVEGVAVPTAVSSGSGAKHDQTSLNKMKASLMKARIRKDPKLSEMEKEYDEAVKASQRHDPTVVSLSAMDNRMLSSAPRNEIRVVTNKRGAERGHVEENEDMSIDDMVREERRTRHESGGEAKRFAERIAKDGKFDNDLEYMDENASKLAKRVHKSDVNLRNLAINEYQKLNKVLENCPLCHHEDTETPPVAPVVSLATRAYLTLPTEPELSAFAAMIVPIEHRVNLLECDDDEWEEIRNFMKSLTRLYHDQGRDIIFYENAAHPNRKPHAAMVAIPLPYNLGETAPAFFKEAFLTTEDEWSQHKKIIDTLSKSKQGLGKLAFRRTLAKEMPYFHVWFELNGGLGHIVEDAQRWPKGDLFAREIIGGMLGLEPDVVKRQGRWHRGLDSRTETFRKVWKKFDWTHVLTG